MKKRSNKRYLLVILFVLIIGSLIIIYIFTRKENPKYLSDLTKMSLNEVNSYAKENSIVISEKIIDQDDCKKDVIVDQSIKPNTIINKNQKIEITKCSGVSLLKLYEENNVNELGKIPIMMYHGIVDKKNSETQFTGGNVDKDGYNRTTEAFRDDLKFYYTNGFRMVRLIDVVTGKITTQLGKSPLVLTFDDGNKNNINVTGLDEKGNIIIDPNSAVGILEAFKKKYNDFNITATFFLNGGLFKQPVYNDKILNWLIEHGYDIGNHSYSHSDFTKLNEQKSLEEIGKMYNLLESKLKDKYVPIVALPFGSPYKKDHVNFKNIINSEYDSKKYETKSTLKVGYLPNVSPFDINYDKIFLNRIRAYDNDGKEFDIKGTFERLKTTKYVSDGDDKTIVIKKSDESNLNLTSDKKIIKY